MAKKVIATWSGGKDSCLATYKAMQQGYEVAYLANTISHDFKRVRFHGVEARVIQLQASLINVPLLQKTTTPGGYPEEFKENLKPVLKHDISGLVFGDIHLADCFSWAENICKDLHLSLIEPIWQVSQERILLDFINAGFEAVVVSTQADLLGKEWLGKMIDKEFLKNIKKENNVDLCGENGEFHTLVLNGPLFQRGIAIQKAQKVLKNGYWFLDIQQYS